MINLSDKTVVVSGRIPPELKRKMIEHGLSVKDAIEIAIYTKANPQIEDKAELIKLLSENQRLSNKMVSNNQQIEILKERLGLDGSNSELTKKLLADSNSKAINNTLDRYFQWRGDKNLSIYDFIEMKSDIIHKQLEKCDLSEEEFKLKLIEGVEDFKQTTLD